MFQRSVFGVLSCSALVILCFLPTVTPLSKALCQKQAVKFNIGATVWQQLNYHDTSSNQLGCREYRHLFSTAGQGIAVDAEYPIQVPAMKSNVWLMWFIKAVIKRERSVKGTAWHVFLKIFLPFFFFIQIHNNVRQFSLWWVERLIICSPTSLVCLTRKKTTITLSATA